MNKKIITDNILFISIRNSIAFKNHIQNMKYVVDNFQRLRILNEDCPSLICLMLLQDNEERAFFGGGGGTGAAYSDRDQYSPTHKEMQMLRESLDQQTLQTRQALAQLVVLRDQLITETNARVEAQVRHRLLTEPMIGSGSTTVY